MPLMPVSQLFMAQSHLMQHRGMQIVDRDHIFHAAVSEFVRSTVAQATFDTTTSQQRSAGIAIVVSSGAVLGNGQSTKLTGPDDQRIVEQATLPEVLDQCAGWLVDDFADFFVIRLHVSMGIPRLRVGVAWWKHLNEPYARFDQPSRHQATCRVT